jgi:hypothetical protein
MNSKTSSEQPNTAAASGSERQSTVFAVGSEHRNVGPALARLRPGRLWHSPQGPGWGPLLSCC